MRLSLTIVAAFSTVAFTQIASAADLPVKAAPAPVSTSYNWAGWYVGANAGYHAGGGSVTTAADPGPFAFSFDPESSVATTLATTAISPKQRGFIGGGQIGYNLQWAPQWLAGVEADFQGLSGEGSATLSSVSGVPGFPAETFVSTTTVTKKIDWLRTLRGRLGFLITPNLLAYGTGGLAYGHVTASTGIAQTDTGILPGPVAGTGTTAGSISQTRAGWALGGGAEWKFAPQWSVKAEYLHYDLGSVSWSSPNLVVNVAGFAAPTFSTVNVRSSTRFQGDIGRVGINYKF